MKKEIKKRSALGDDKMRSHRSMDGQGPGCPIGNNLKHACDDVGWRVTLWLDWRGTTHKTVAGAPRQFGVMMPDWV